MRKTVSVKDAPTHRKPCWKVHSSISHREWVERQSTDEVQNILAWCVERLRYHDAQAKYWDERNAPGNAEQHRAKWNAYEEIIGKIKPRPPRRSEQSDAGLLVRLRDNGGGCPAGILCVEQREEAALAIESLEAEVRRLRRAAALPPIADLCADCGDRIPIMRECPYSRNGFGHRMTISKEAWENWNNEYPV